MTEETEVESKKSKALLISNIIMVLTLVAIVGEIYLSYIFITRLNAPQDNEIAQIDTSELDEYNRKLAVIQSQYDKHYETLTSELDELNRQRNKARVRLSASESRLRKAEAEWYNIEIDTLNQHDGKSDKFAKERLAKMIQERLAKGGVMLTKERLVAAIYPVE